MQLWFFTLNHGSLYLNHHHHHYHHYCQNSSLWAVAFPRRFCNSCLFRLSLDHPLSTCLDFAIVFFCKARSALCPTSDLEDEVPQWHRCPVPDSLSVACYDSQGCGGGIISGLHTGSFRRIISFICSVDSRLIGGRLSGIIVLTISRARN
jgi:hypothetical protein